MVRKALVEQWMRKEKRIRDKVRQSFREAIQLDIPTKYPCDQGDVYYQLSVGVKGLSSIQDKLYVEKVKTYKTREAVIDAIAHYLLEDADYFPSHRARLEAQSAAARVVESLEVYVESTGHVQYWIQGRVRKLHLEVCFTSEH